jgi:hypothetical protein
MRGSPRSGADERRQLLDVGGGQQDVAADSLADATALAPALHAADGALELLGGLGGGEHGGSVVPAG